jgi:hypothetical protein
MLKWLEVEAAYSVGNAGDLHSELRLAEGSVTLECRPGSPSNTSMAIGGIESANVFILLQAP